MTHYKDVVVADLRTRTIHIVSLQASEDQLNISLVASNSQNEWCTSKSRTTVFHCLQITNTRH